MHRESIYLCTYMVEQDEQIAHVRAWDAREAAELFARELELDSGSAVAAEDVRVRLIVRGGDEPGPIAA